MPLWCQVILHGMARILQSGVKGRHQLPFKNWRYFEHARMTSGHAGLQHHPLQGLAVGLTASAGREPGS